MGHPVKHDKREQCGCHKRCTVLPHDCENPCVWPDCLTEEEHKQLCDEVYQALVVDTEEHGYL